MILVMLRQLEALIRFSQARAKACLREFVLKEDAYDVIELMHESVNQVHMDGQGRIDRTRGGKYSSIACSHVLIILNCVVIINIYIMLSTFTIGVGGKSKRKQKKQFMDALKMSGNTFFSKDDFYRISSDLDLPLGDFWNMVDELRYSDQPELRKNSDGTYCINV